MPELEINLFAQANFDIITDREIIAIANAIVNKDPNDIDSMLDCTKAIVTEVGSNSVNASANTKNRIETRENNVFFMVLLL